MATMKDPKVLALAYIEAGGQKQFDLLSAFFHENLEFEGRFATFHSAQEYIAAYRRLGAILLRNEVKKVFVDGNEVCVIYDLVTDTPAGAVPCVEWITVDGGRIRSIRLYFDRLQFEPAREELARRAASAPKSQTAGSQ